MKINTLNLYTSRLEEQLSFYQNCLQLPLTARTPTMGEFKIGYSTLRFSYRIQAKPYHFAINIPSNKAQDALNWLKLRVSVLKDENEELIHFKSWNAEAVYFYDGDRNVVEFIARKNLKTEAQSEFGPHQLLCISEIGIPVEDIEYVFNQLNSIRELTVYDGDFKRFCAAGDENGLFILVNRNNKKWYPTNDEAFSSDFILAGDFNLKFENGKIIKVQ